MAVDLNIDGLFTAINNGFDFAGQATGGLASQGTNVGEILGVVAILVMVAIALGIVVNKFARPLMNFGGRYV